MEEQQTLPPAPSLMNTMTDIFTSPSEIFQNLKGTAPAALLWVVPMILTILLGVIITVTMSYNETLLTQIIENQRHTMEKQVEEGKISQEMADQAIEQMETGMDGSMFIVFGSVGAAIMITLYFFLGPLFLWLANKLVFKSSEGYGKHLEVYGIASWIGLLGGVITLLMMVGLGSLYAQPSGALLLLSSYDVTDKTHKLLGALNIFTIWQTAAIGIGIAKLSDKSTGAALGLVFALWIVWVLIQVFFGFGM